MTRDQFKRVVGEAMERVTAEAELAAGRELPRRYCFSWLGLVEIVAEGDVAEFLTEPGWVDALHIWPCWDLFLERLLSDGRLAMELLDEHVCINLAKDVMSMHRLASAIPHAT